MLKRLADFPAIMKLADALWRQDAKKNGAAIMVGAGFSRCSASHVDGNKHIPLWKDFAASLAAELYGSDFELSFLDPLRLAEEYRAYFGQVALSDLIKKEIQDDAWRPGSSYSKLLSLPWAEVMTTNWDTLLERAAQNVHSPIYSVVTKPSDLASSRSPRIVKLHGTIGVTEEFVVAEEDYRKYPHKFAAFVNFARQVFIENELCLVGFSGDDPNFLQWAGWVRDHLANHARRIYLVGALNLNSAKRKFLESINIAPIDLWDAVSDLDDGGLRHQRAIELFLDTLLEHKPKPNYEWEPTSVVRKKMTSEEFKETHDDNDYAAALLERQLEILQRDRESYPGWLVCPVDLRVTLSSQICDPYPNVKNIAPLAPDVRARLLYEIAWRHIVTLDPVSPWLRSELESIVKPSSCNGITKRQQMEIALLLLKTSRLYGDYAEFERWASLLESFPQYLPDCSAEIAYQKALFSRDRLDYSWIEAEVVAVVGEDPVWKLRQAALYAELGQFDEGERLLAEAYSDLRNRSRNDPSSIRIQSRLAWAQWLYRLVDYPRNFVVGEQAVSNYKTLRCEPWDQITYLKDKVSKQQEQYLASQEDIEPLFEQGHYRDHSSDVKFSNESPLFLHLDGLTEVVGMPLRWDNINLLAGIAEQAVLPDVYDDGVYRYCLAIRTAHSDTSVSIKNVFSRMSLAAAKQESVNELADIVVNAIDYWRKQARTGGGKTRSHSINVIRVLIEVLSRLAIRLSPEKAINIFRLGVDIGNDSSLRHFWLYEVIEHMLQYSLKSIPVSMQSDILLDALSFPLPYEIGIDDSHDVVRWPNPVVDTGCGRVSSQPIDSRISELIDLVVPGKSSCALVLLRLFPLLESGVLSEDELSRLAEKVWGDKPDYMALPNIGLRKHALQIVPAKDRDKANDAISNVLFFSDDSVFYDAEHLYDLYGAACVKGNVLLPDKERAADLFKLLVSWRQPEGKGDPLGFALRERDELAQAIGQALSYSVVPSLEQSDIDQERFDELIALYTEINAASSVVALIYFTGLSDEVVLVVEEKIRKGLQAHSSSDVGWSMQALYKWKELAMAGALPQPSDRLLSKVIYHIETGRMVGLHSMLWYVREMFRQGWLLTEDVQVVTETLPELFDLADYKDIRPNSREAVTASLIRENCVRLAKDLIATEPSPRLSTMIETACQDPLPEVRFACSG